MCAALAAAFIRWISAIAHNMWLSDTTFWKGVYKRLTPEKNKKTKNRPDKVYPPRNPTLWLYFVSNQNGNGHLNSVRFALHIDINIFVYSVVFSLPLYPLVFKADGIVDVLNL